jgi:PKD repeat protein
VFVFSPSSPSATQPVFFNAGQSAPGPRRTISTYRWSFGDGDTGSGRTVTHRYDEEGTYTVLLTVTDDVGQRSTATALVTVCPVGGCEEEDP